MMILDAIHPSFRAEPPRVYIMRLSTWKQAATLEAEERAMPRSMAWNRQTGPGKSTRRTLSWYDSLINLRECSNKIQDF